MKKLSRRSFVGVGTAVVGAGVGLLAGAASGTESKSTKKRSGVQTDYDVIVVGGGFSGVTAARDCQKNGLRTLVLEAKSRLGGRTFDTQFRGHHIELGGTWVHWTQPAVWSEIMRYGLEVEETPGATPDQMIIVSGKERSTFATNDKIEELVTGISRYFAEAGQVWERPYDTELCWKAVTSRDALNAADRLKATPLTPLQRGFLVPVLEAMGHCPVGQVSYAEMLRWYALSLNNWGTAVDALSRYKLRAGTGALVRRIAADGKAEVRLNSPVRRIEQRGDLVVVTPQGGASVSARAVILALPPRVLKNLEFVPSLSSGKLAASREGFTPSGMKLYAEVEGRVGKVEWVASGTQAAGCSGPIRSSRTARFSLASYRLPTPSMEMMRLLSRQYCASSSQTLKCSAA